MFLVVDRIDNEEMGLTTRTTTYFKVIEIPCRLQSLVK